MNTRKGSTYITSLSFLIFKPLKDYLSKSRESFFEELGKDAFRFNGELEHKYTSITLLDDYEHPVMPLPIQYHKNWENLQLGISEYFIARKELEKLLNRAGGLKCNMTEIRAIFPKSVVLDNEPLREAFCHFPYTPIREHLVIGAKKRYPLVFKKLNEQEVIKIIQ